LQVIQFTPDVKAALLCRHKKKWTDSDEFPDVAMIFHNKQNGQTCWFQTDDSGERVVNGVKVPSPLAEKANGFWMKPQATAGVQCIQCHDNGPWMNSRWMNDSLRRLKGKGAPGDPLQANEFQDSDNPLADDKGKYLSEGIGFSAWKPPTYVTVARHNLAHDEDKTCTRCHNIAAADTTSDSSQAPYRNCSNLKSWIAYTTGTEYAKSTNHTGMDFTVANWMPDGHFDTGATDTLQKWSDRYKPHLDDLVACCKAKGVGNNCQLVKPTSNSRPSSVPGVRLAAVTDAGIRYESAIPAAGPTVQVNTGTAITMSWSADQNFHACTIEATFPEGVRTFPSGSAAGVGTASNWQLDDSPQEIGKLKDPGLYRFDIYCGGDNTTSLKIQAVTPPPPPPPPGPVDCSGVTLSPTQATIGPDGGSGAFSVIFPDITKCSIFSVDAPPQLGWIIPGSGAGTCVSAANTQCVTYSVAPLNPPPPKNIPPPPPNPPRSGIVEVVLKDMSTRVFHIDQQN
jgi:hypothetical protein